MQTKKCRIKKCNIRTYSLECPFRIDDTNTYSGHTFVWQMQCALDTGQALKELDRLHTNYQLHVILDCSTRGIYISI